MTETTAATAAPPVRLPPDPTRRLRQRASAIALPLGFAGQLVANLGYSWATREGGDDLSGASALELYGREPGLMAFVTVAALLGCLLIVSGAFAAARVLRPWSPRLTLLAVLTVVTGYICYFGIVATNFVTIALAQAGVDAARPLDEAQSMPAAVPMFVLFLIGNMGGALLLASAVFRSPEVSGWAGAGILSWFVLHVIGLVVGSEWFEVAGGALQVAGLAVIARRAIRLTPREWAERG